MSTSSIPTDPLKQSVTKDLPPQLNEQIPNNKTYQNGHKQPMVHSESDYFGHFSPQRSKLPVGQSFMSLPSNPTVPPHPSKQDKPAHRGLLQRMETAPQDGWKLVKKWIGNNKSQLRMVKQTMNLERQAETNMLSPLVLAMFLSRDDDENNARRIPIFLNNITVKVTKEEDDDSSMTNFSKGSSDGRKNKFRGTTFRIIVQYGTGSGKISWFVFRRYWDFVKLHYHYKYMNSNLDSKSGNGLLYKQTKPPNFPSIPKQYFRRNKLSAGHRHPINTHQSEHYVGIDSDVTQHTPFLMDEEAVMALVTINEEEPNAFTPSITGIPAPTHRPFSQVVDIVKADQDVLHAMEDYLNQLVSNLVFCRNINRLCRFLEISNLGVHLSAKYPKSNYHGKEGYAFFQSRTDRDPRHKRTRFQDGIVCSLPTAGGKRKRKPKWFIVRDSYIVCVDSPSETEIYDVFLFDQMFDIHRLALFSDKRSHAKGNRKKVKNAIANASHWTSGRSTLCFKNMNGVYHFRAKDENTARQFERSIQMAARHSLWCQINRFKSFAPVRENVPATWYVDGRDYFWDLSVALENATECIYIHDWWLSPELFLRRPAASNLEWRLDRVLRRKADQGVKVFIVMYKEVSMALPLFSHQAKRNLLALSPNIYVQRHPSRMLDIFNKDVVFFWAHHEKICVVDNEIAFVGGIDKCFGRWDTPTHAVVDDRDPELTPDNQNPQVWSGKDYSNPRIIDFHTLDKPFEDNQDRKTLPRMPWHDISLRIVGPAARDVARHFVQRWNFLRRKKPNAPKRPTPMLLPVPDAYTNKVKEGDKRICHPHFSSSCRVQILRSVSPWSIGSTDHVEKSIQNAYVESIRDSKHLVYIENQFFVTTTKSGNTKIENNIGEALYQRIVRAHQLGEKWRAIIIVPLVPGFPANIDETEATTVRIIMQCQYLSVARGPHSLLARLHAAGVLNTHEYINFYGLRNWGELNGQYVTEQVYIHAKTMIVDDQTVIIGSANINERSMLGTRDSEIAACIQEDEKDLIEITFHHQPVRVSRFAHQLRMRLMCEHIGLDVDRMDRERREEVNDYFQEPVWSDCHLDDDDKNDLVNCIPPYIQVTAASSQPLNEKEQAEQERNDLEQVKKKQKAQEEQDLEEQEKRSMAESYLDSSDDTSSESSHATYLHNTLKGESKPYSADQKRLSQAQSIQTTDTSKESILSPTKSIFSNHKRKSIKEDYHDFWTSLDPDTDNNGDRRAWEQKRETGENKQEAKASDSEVLESTANYYSSARLDPLCMEHKTVADVYHMLQDPLTDEFQTFWHMLARINTDLFRRCFLVTPDNNVRNWEQYNHFVKMSKLFLGRVDVKHGGTKTTAAAANVTAIPLNESDHLMVKQVLRHIRGHLVIWPSHFMEEEDEQNQFLTNVDKLAPLEIFD
ncbi:hypothetical protein EDC96DRAFT_579571 [Choanephora cucurbitarum]|nr:hypothetical protein EDC96DRAFT_579571 [Choanephora cucurbitarum]